MLREILGVIDINLPRDLTGLVGDDRSDICDGEEIEIDFPLAELRAAAARAQERRTRTEALRANRVSEPGAGEAEHIAVALEACAAATVAQETTDERRQRQQATYASHDHHNAKLGLAARGIAAERALIDRRLDESAIRVLGAILYHMNAANLRAWPSYATIGAITGYGDDRILKAIRQLIDGGYLIRERKAPQQGGRALVHYGLRAMHKEERDALISAYVAEYKKTGIRSKEHPDAFMFDPANPQI